MKIMSIQLSMAVQVEVSKKDSALLLCFFSFSKIPGGLVIYRQNARVLEIQPQLKFRGGRSYLRTILSEPKFVCA